MVTAAASERGAGIDPVVAAVAAGVTLARAGGGDAPPLGGGAGHVPPRPPASPRRRASASRAAGPPDAARVPLKGAPWRAGPGPRGPGIVTSAIPPPARWRPPVPAIRDGGRFRLSSVSGRVC